MGEVIFFILIKLNFINLNSVYVRHPAPHYNRRAKGQQEYTVFRNLQHMGYELDGLEKG
jgi:hypothetical protein